MITASEGTIVVRDAVASDNNALLGVCEACTMEGDVALRIDRRPDFFALNALEGDAWRVGTTEDGAGALTGCVAAARRDVWMNGQPRTACYVSDLKVIPAARGGGAADELSRYAAQTCHDFAGVDVPTLATILAGNARVERRASGVRGLPMLRRVATINALAIPLLWERRERVDGYTVRAATANDLEAMTDLWWHVSARRQFASWFTPDSLDNWIRTAPGLSVSDYLLAHDSHGRLQGFIGIWDQTCLKQLRVVSYSRRLGVMRGVINLVAQAIGGPVLPPAGEALPVLASVHCCASTPSVLRALLLEAYRRRRGGAHALLTIGLDVRDPLMAATRGLLAPPTFVHAYLTSPAGRCDEVLDDRPFHLETALT